MAYHGVNKMKYEPGSLLDEAHIYLCGPPMMMSKIIRILASLKVSDNRIHFERFTL